MTQSALSFPFRLCADDANNAIAATILAACMRKIEEYDRTCKGVVSLILTGSFSRGEGSVVPAGSGKMAVVLGDMEFFVLLDAQADFNVMQDKLTALSSRVTSELGDAGISCKTEFSPVARGYLRRAKPTIFNYELKRHGKVVYGRADVLTEMPPFVAADIPVVDGFYLLCNRIVEQLLLYRKLAGKATVDIKAGEYELVKFYIDMAGSYLTVCGEYQPTYAERATGFHGDALHTPQDEAAFVTRLQSATRYKLHPDKENSGIIFGEQNSELMGYEEAAGFCRYFWAAEVERVFGITGGVIGAEFCRAVTRTLPMKEVLRGWFKLIRTAIRQGRPLAWHKIPGLLRTGPPRLLIYCGAAHLYFGIAGRERVDLNLIGGLLPFPGAITTETEALDAVIGAWHDYVRSA